jgi:threonine synthase
MGLDAPLFPLCGISYGESSMSYQCSLCGKTHSLEERIFRCDCGGFLQVGSANIFPKEHLERRGLSIWRYREAFGLPADVEAVSLGEGRTPLVRRTVDGDQVTFKLDYLQPSGSFKDRGASVLLSLVKALGVSRVVEDSSGNAGSAISAYASAAGIGCTVYVPDYTPEGKLVQIRLYGSEVVKVPGKRQDANDAVIRASQDCHYASHLWNPFFVAGMKSVAFEIWEELDRQAPAAVVAPLGAGSNIEGVYLGFTDLVRSGYAEAIPRLIGIQAEHCAPIHRAFQADLEDFARLEVDFTVAEGIAVQQPPRSRAVLHAIRQSGGWTLAVSEGEILDAARQLYAMGFYVEPTSAAALAGWLKLDRAARRNSVLLLTGNGLKESRKLADLFLSA